MMHTYECRFYLNGPTARFLHDGTWVVLETCRTPEQVFAVTGESVCHLISAAVVAERPDLADRIIYRAAGGKLACLSGLVIEAREDGWSPAKAYAARDRSTQQSATSERELTAGEFAQQLARLGDNINQMSLVARRGLKVEQTAASARPAGMSTSEAVLALVEHNEASQAFAWITPKEAATFRADKQLVSLNSERSNEATVPLFLHLVTEVPSKAKVEGPELDLDAVRFTYCPACGPREDDVCHACAANRKQISELYQALAMARAMIASDRLDAEIASQAFDKAWGQIPSHGAIKGMVALDEAIQSLAEDRDECRTEVLNLREQLATAERGRRLAEEEVAFLHNRHMPELVSKRRAAELELSNLKTALRGLKKPDAASEQAPACETKDKTDA